MSSRGTILVTGATGKVGRNVVFGLLDAGVRVRALVRTPATAGLSPEVDLVRGDLTDAATVDAAARGADAAYLLWPSFDGAGAAEAVEALARNVGASGLPVGRLGPRRPGDADAGHLVYRRGPDRDQRHRLTILRAGGFAGNALAWAEQVRSGQDRVQLAFPRAARSLIHERDIADVAVAALVEPGHVGQAYTLTGPQTLSQTEQVRLVADATGRTLEVEERPREAKRADLLAAWGDPVLVDGALDYWASLVSAPEEVTDTFERIARHPGRTFREWADDHVDDFGPL